MANTRSCVSFLADNIAQDCTDLRKTTFRGDGLIFDLDENSATTITTDSGDPHKITAIEVRKTAEAQNPDGVVYEVNNLLRTPFEGANKTLNVEDGRPSYDSSLPIRIPNVSGRVARDVIEPLSSGRFIGIFPTENGKYFVYGAYGRWNASEMTWNPSENGSDAVATMTSNEPYAIVETTAAVYEQLKALVPA